MATKLIHLPLRGGFSVLFLLEVGLISDQQGVPKMMLQDLQGYVLRGSAASALAGIPVRARTHHGRSEAATL